MDPKKFRQTTTNSVPPAEISLHLQSLWYDAAGNWERSHQLIQDEPDAFSARIHGYLHRKEGDQFNAGYWYRRAGCAFPSCSLEAEWDELVAEAPVR